MPEKARPQWASGRVAANAKSASQLAKIATRRFRG
jgi:hypothetical protein